MRTRPPSGECGLVRWSPFTPSCTPLWTPPLKCRGHRSGFRLDEGRGLPFMGNPTLTDEP